MPVVKESQADFASKQSQVITQDTTADSADIVQCAAQVGTNTVELPQPNHPQSNQAVVVRLQLTPVGHLWHLGSPERVVRFAISLLVTLNHIHAQGFVHCDVRADNVVETSGGWVLIDWELAGRTPAVIFWDSHALPPGVHRGDHWLVKHDLWQLGKLLREQSNASPGVKGLANELQSGSLTASSALGHPALL